MVFMVYNMQDYYKRKIIMKKFKKSTAIILSVIISVLMAVGLVFSFVPMTFGAKTFVSLSGSVNVSPDLVGAMYCEYDIVTENATKNQIVSSMTYIQNVLEEKGYKNANIYAIGNKKVRVEISSPKGDETYATTYATLKSLTSGAFSLRSTYNLEESSIVVDGAKAVEKIEMFTNNNTKTLAVIFNEKGQEDYKKLCQSGSGSIYLVLGDYSQQISIDGVYDFTQLTLSNEDYENLKELKQKIELGCTMVQLNSETAEPSTMSSNLSAGESASSSSVKSFNSSIAYVVGVSAFFIVLVMGISVFAVKFGLYAILMLVTLLINSSLFLGLVCLMPSIELGLSGFAALVVGTSVIYTYAFAFASKVKAEYNMGKSLNAALESAFKKQMPGLLVGNITLFLSSLIMIAFAFGELSSLMIIFAICSFLSLFTNLAIIPLLVKICISFDGFGRKLFMLKKRSLGIDSVSEEELAKEGE